MSRDNLRLDQRLAEAPEGGLRAGRPEVTPHMEDLMDLVSLHHSQLRTVHAPKHSALLESACARHRALAPLRTERDVLAMLSNTDPDRYSEREAITHALVWELQSTSHPFWFALLQVAYFPMLFRLRLSLHVDEHATNEEVDQLVITSFLETVHTVDLEAVPDRLCMRLRQDTRRRVLRTLRRERREHHLSSSRDHEDIIRAAERVYSPTDDEPPFTQQRCLWPDVRSSGPRPLSPSEKSELSVLAVEKLGAILSPEELELVIAKNVRGESLSAYARCLARGEPEDRQVKEYQRLRTCHSRAGRRIREVLGSGGTTIGASAHRFAATRAHAGRRGKHVSVACVGLSRNM